MSHERLRPEYLFDEEKINQLKQLAPECFEDGKINFDTLKQNLGEWAQDEEGELEHFGLFWPGKKDARRIAAIPPQGTLVPAFGEGLKADGTTDEDGFNDSNNIFIEGENLEVLKILQKSYAGKIKMIYIDPPYNTGKDFIYDDNFTEPLQEYLGRTGQVDEEGKALTTNKRSDGRFHSKWLSMMYPRLRLARNLLTENGVIFMSIDENEYHNLKSISNEIFGEESYLGTIVWKNATDNNPTQIAIEHEYVIVFCKNTTELESEWKSSVSDVKDVLVNKGNELLQKFSDDITTAEKEFKVWYKENKPYLWPLDRYKYFDEGGVYTGSQSVHNPGREGYRYDVIHPKTGMPCKEPLMGYRFPEETMDRLLEEGKILFGESHEKIIELKLYAHEYREKLSSVFELDGRLGSYDLKGVFEESKRIFNNPKPIRFLTQFFQLLLGNGEIVLDFFGGSASTAHSILDLNDSDGLNRKFIMVQLPQQIEESEEAYKNGFENLAQLSSERIRRVIVQNKYSQGFSYQKLQNSNYKKWSNYNGTAISELEENLDLFNQEPLTEGWTKEGLLSEIILMEGFVLSSNINEQEQYTSNEVRKVSDEYCEHSLLVCLDEKIDQETIASLELSGNDIFICLDSAISNVDKLRLSDKGLIKTI